MNTQYPGAISLSIGGVHKRSHLWILTPAVGTLVNGGFDIAPLYLTDHQRPITFEGHTFSPVDAAYVTAGENRDNMRSANFTATGVISSTKITADDLRAGRWDNASLEEIVVDPRYPWASTFRRHTFFLGEFTFNPTREVWEADVRSLVSKLQNNVGSNYAYTCPYTLGDANCGFDILTVGMYGAVVVTAVSIDPTDPYIVGAPSAHSGEVDFYRHGLVAWFTGPNNGHHQTIREYSVEGGLHYWRMQQPFYKTPAVGNVVLVFPGCNKWSGIASDGTIDPDGHCLNKFNNLVNFGGYPTMPSDEIIALTPALKETDG